MSEGPALVLQNVALVEGGARLFDGLTLEVARGERVAILGESGTGKSLVLRIATGLTLPTAGIVQLFGTDMGTADADARRLARAHCGLVLQGGSLLGDLTVEENLWLGLDAPSSARRRLRRRLDRVMLEFHLEDGADRVVNRLSAGEQRRVELARAFLRDPDLLILDEPFEGAFAHADRLETQIARYVIPRGRALLLLTQDEALARRLCDRVFRLERGRLVQQSVEDSDPDATSRTTASTEA